MSLLSRFSRHPKNSAQAVKNEIINAFYDGRETNSGIRVNDDKAMQISTVNSCVSIISEDIGSLPLKVFKRVPGGKEEVPNHPLYDLLYRRPNPWQTSMDWRSQMLNFLLFRGNYYGAILRHGDDIIDDIIPLHPDKVKVKQLPDYSLSYDVTLTNGEPKTIRQEDILHIRGLSSNGITGRGVITDAREMFGSALATQEYSAKLFKNDATPGIVIKYPNKFKDEEAAKRFAESWNAGSQGVGNSHKTRVLEEGASLERLSMTAEDSQFIETRKMQRSEIASLFHVPLILLSANENTATYASAEQNMLAFVMHCLRPWLVRIEQAILNQLFIAPLLYFPEHNLDGLLRADIKTRYEAYQIGRNSGWLSKNDVRAKENMNPIDGGDDYRSLAEIQNKNKGAPDGP